jgi:hypothetical protein
VNHAFFPPACDFSMTNRERRGQGHWSFSEKDSFWVQYRFGPHCLSVPIPSPALAAHMDLLSLPQALASAQGLGTWWSLDLTF